MRTETLELYKDSLALCLDLYELTMAYGFWKEGMTEYQASFSLFFRTNPFKGGYSIAAGLETAIHFIKNFAFDSSDITYLRSITKVDGTPLFEEGFLSYLADLRLSCDIDAIEEGTVVFPYEPIIRITAPLIQAQLLEGFLLNCINFQTLIATKASRICIAAGDDEVIEFGLRRAQGVDGAFSGARAAYIGGCRSTSNVMAGKYLGIPLRGTHAHSWVMAFDSEIASFEAFAKHLPDRSILLIDTYDTIEGCKKAITVAKLLKEEGKALLGVRIDSGDLLEISKKIRTILDEEGFKAVKIIASNQLDEYTIDQLKKSGAKIDAWGVGTNLITAKDQPALDGVYKLTSIKKPHGEWEDRVKISEQEEKSTIPGILQVKRYYADHFILDMIYDEKKGIDSKIVSFDQNKEEIMIDPLWKSEDLLVPIFRSGILVYNLPSLESIQKRTKTQLATLNQKIRQIPPNASYTVGLSKKLYETKKDLTSTR